VVKTDNSRCFELFSVIGFKKYINASGFAAPAEVLASLTGRTNYDYKDLFCTGKINLFYAGRIENY